VQSPSNVWPSEVPHNVYAIIKEDIRNVYLFEKKVGTGAYGGVRTAIRLDKRYAVKTLQRKQCEKDISMLERELSSLKKLDSPYVAKFYEVYYDFDYINIVTEFIDGGDILSIMLQEPERRFAENKARDIIWDCLLGLNHLHANEIAHRDLKPENMMFGDGKTKLIDFGFSGIFKKDQENKSS
jgi:serine/threonine protein kinase